MNEEAVVIREWTNDCQRNKLIGTALEKAVRLTKPETGDTSIKQAIQEMLNKKDVPKVYIVKHKFMINKVTFFKSLPINIDTLEEGDVKSTDIIKDKNIKICDNEKCIYHKQSLLYDKKVRRCRLCKDKLKTYVQFTEKETFLFNGTKEQIISFLCEKGYIQEVRQLKRRIDKFDFYANNIVITESKKWRILKKNAIKSSLLYPIVLQLYSKITGKICDSLNIVYYSDEISDEAEQYVIDMSSLHKIKINLIDINTWINNNKTQNGYIHSVVGDYNFNDKRYIWSFEYSDNSLTNELMIKFKKLNDVKEYHISSEQAEQNQANDSRLAVVEALTALKKEEKRDDTTETTN